MKLKKKCEHLMVDSWHVPTQEARELVRARDQGPYGWRDHIRAEMTGSLSRWMWPGLAALLVAGILIRDWWLIIGAVAALGFFLYQAVTLVRTLGKGEVVTTTSRTINKTEHEDKDPVWAATAPVKGVRRDLVVTCAQCIDALREGTRLELAVLIDPTDAGNNWVIGFREK